MAGCLSCRFIFQSVGVLVPDGTFEIPKGSYGLVKGIIPLSL